MSWCVATDIGRAATTVTVKAVEQALAEQGVVFYKPSMRWFVSNPSYIRIDENKYRVDTTKQLVDLSEVKLYNSGWRNPTTVTVESFTGRSAVIVSEDLIYAGTPMGFTGETGAASKLELAAGVDLKAGDTVIRSDKVVFIETDGVSAEGDIQLISPESMRLCAISIGRRLVILQDDENADWDNGMNTLFDGWRDILERYI